MRERKVFLIFILLFTVSYVSGLIYEHRINGKSGEEYITTEGTVYKEVWNSEKDLVLETGDYFGRVLVKNVSFAKRFIGKRIKLTGKVSVPESARNPGGFSQAAFLAGKNIYHVMECDMISETEGFAFSLRAIGSAIRQKAEAATAELMGDNRGFMLGVMTGDSSALDKEMKSYVRLSGISHLFAVSGMHVEYVLMPFQKGVRRKSIGIGVRSVLCIIPIIFFAILTGLSPSVVRAAAGTSYGLVAKAVKRKPDPLNAIGVGGIICLALYPLATKDTGFILSFGAVLSAYFLLPVIKKIKKKESKLFDIISYGLAVNIGLLPVMIYKYGAFSPVGILITVIASPLSAVLCVFGYASVLLYAFPFTRYIAKIISYGLTSVTKLIEKISETGALIPNIRLPIYYAWLIAAFYAVCIFLTAKEKKKTRMLAAILFFVFLLLFTYMAVKKNQAKIIWFDVGQGSCALVQTEEGKRILIDGGTGYTDVSDLLNKNGYRRIDYVIVSHGDEDHSGGIYDVLRNNSVKALIVPDNPDDANCAELASLAEENNIKVIKISESCRMKMSKNSELTMYFYRDSASLNNSSVVVQLNAEGRSVLFPGDLEIKGEKKLAESGIIGECDIVTASHHGSGGATGNTLLELTKPRLSVISVGKNNFYGHPAAETLERLNTAGINILRTDRDGAVIVRLFADYIGADTWLTEKKLIIR